MVDQGDDLLVDRPAEHHLHDVHRLGVGHPHPLHELALLAGTIAYEIVCRVSPRVPRVYIRGGQTVRVKTMLDSHA
uniref:Alanine racemase C-terminal domain-containing protein n=1 Tax=candidate division WOR-3 bacterium TaxID=2052148 RepID=A0A7C4CDN2_UNCW3